ncbi:Rieske 2Fe-2S domain-containing protein [Noviherbaspirillum pedocola]|uniref:Rieske 2Fe-2S domain-containing protein n=1 Tax=Noviherbaspirillum pedocola TaxID=2801341 RepID=A0A934W8S9_9BURK|nr:Rieske 2Fe-2S domain-containing protein [Noviherbaspirillum pedocola]MBK4739017.1 Rieske 2Fe-2S domain-containing protein [Noviherbaspirillum pedocola]
MLSKEDNESLVRVGPGTPMGQLMRLYWIPFLPSSDLAVDGQPQRVRLLGEDLVAFRDSEGRIGLVDHACPHRGAPLIFGRNEGCGLRCVYHGWKFGVDGKLMDTPTEPAESRLKDRTRIKSYLCQERNGVAWAYMGPDQDVPPPLPNIEWNMVPPENAYISFRVQECNWLQALEGEIDSAHAAILHGRVDAGGNINQWKQAADLAPKFEVLPHDGGLHIASLRELGENKRYVRVNQFLMPFWTFVPPFSGFPELSGHAWVPIDDEHSLCVMFSYDPVRPLPEKTRKLFDQGHAGRQTAHPSLDSFETRAVSVPYHRYWSKYNRANAYGFDYDVQVRKYNSGMPGLWIQDAACQSGVMPIYDRSAEHLGTSDTGVAMTRRMLLDKVRKLAANQQRPARCDDPDAWMVRAVSLTLPAEGSWKDDGSEFMKARLGTDLGYTP